jgi:hypothetical protein
MGPSTCEGNFLKLDAGRAPRSINFKNINYLLILTKILLKTRYLIGTVKPITAMLRALFLHRVRRHAQRIFQFLFPEGYQGEIFLCGGAFEPLLKKGLHLQDLDLWVRDRKERQTLCNALIDRGAILLHDFHPYCLKFRLEGQIIEITYHNVKDGTLEDVVSTFDISLSAIGVRLENGAVQEAHIDDECWHAIRKGEVSVMDAYFCFIDMMKAPCLLRTLHRMGQKAAELHLSVNVDHEHRLWEIYWHDYCEEERRAAMDLYFDTMVAYKGQHDPRLVHRATIGYAPVEPAQGDKVPIKLVTQHA